jgi:hypothetical protein
LENNIENEQELFAKTQNSYNVELNSFNDFDMVNSFYGYFDYYTKEQLLQYICNPMYYHKQIMDVSEKMYNRNGIFGQTVSKMVAAPSLDSVIVPYDTKKKNKSNLNKAYDIFNNKINHKLSTRDILLNSLLYGEYVAIWRDTKKKNIERPHDYASGKNIEGVGYVDNIMLQPLDLRYCRFEGFANGDYVVSFDMQYFDMFSGSNLVGEIKNYPKEFLTGYNTYKKDGTKRWMLLPQETTFAYKYRGAINESHGRSLAIFALLDILFAEDYTDSQRNNMYENSSTIRWMELPEGEKKGTCSLNKDQQNNQYNTFKNAVKSSDAKRNRLGGTTTLKLAPGSKIGKLENSDTFLKETLTEENNKAISTSLGLALSALNGTGQGASYSTLQTNIDLLLSEVFSMLEQISFQYTKLINNYLNLTDDNRLDFVYLNTSSLNADSMYDKYKDLYTFAGGSRIMLYSSVCGNAQLYLRLMDFEKSESYDDKYLPHVTSFTASDNADNPNPDGNIGGKPKKKSGQLTDSGIQTRTNGGNKQIKPSTK